MSAGGAPAPVLSEGASLPDAMIAIVDDDALVRSAIASLLRSIGYRVTTFENAAEFLLSQHDFDCLVSDVQMPGMTGVQLHRRLRSVGEELPMVLTTAFPTEAVNAYADESDVVALLEKPVESERLIAAIEEALGEPHA
jgi:FixJ family two-component response regulator